jgi:opacity protein-like surface antigen
MGILRLALCLVISGSVPSRAWSRVFDIKKETIGSYLKTDYTQSALGTELYSLSSGTNTRFAAAGVDYHSAFELGFIYTIKVISLRLGIETVRSKPLTLMSGTDAGGVELMSIDSSVSTVAPTFHLDLNLLQTNLTRFYMGIGVGQVILKVLNNYTFTSAGQAAFPGIANYNEQIQAQFVSGVFTLGFEFAFADTTTMSLEVGYRTLSGTQLTHQAAIPQTIDGGAISVGDPAKNSDGSDRAVNMTGPFIGIAYRFYVSII